MEQSNASKHTTSWAAILSGGKTESVAGANVTVEGNAEECNLLPLDDFVQLSCDNAPDYSLTLSDRSDPFVLAGPHPTLSFDAIAG
jgi:hypothetical protein